MILWVNNFFSFSYFSDPFTFSYFFVIPFMNTHWSFTKFGTKLLKIRKISFKSNSEKIIVAEFQSSFVKFSWNVFSLFNFLSSSLMTHILFDTKNLLTKIFWRALLFLNELARNFWKGAKRSKEKKTTPPESNKILI